MCDYASVEWDVFYMYKCQQCHLVTINTSNLQIKVCNTYTTHLMFHLKFLCTMFGIYYLKIIHTETNTTKRFYSVWSEITLIRTSLLKWNHNWKCHKNCSKLNFCLQRSHSENFFLKSIIVLFVQEKYTRRRANKNERCVYVKGYDNFSIELD